MAIKPTFTFQIMLPYTNSITTHHHHHSSSRSSNTSHNFYQNNSAPPLEVVNLEWNEDGTALGIVQRRKGVGSLSTTAPFATSSITPSLGNMHHHHHSSNSRTNKKKSRDYSSSSLSSSNHHPSMSGNTAVSFWSVPDWLWMDYDDDYFDTNDDIDVRDDFEDDIMKNYGLDGVNHHHHANYHPDVALGDDSDDEDSNKTYFPLWEWYLTNYLFRDELLLNPSSMNSNHHSSNIHANSGGNHHNVNDPYYYGHHNSSKNNMHNNYGNLINTSHPPLAKNIIEMQAFPMELASPPPSTTSTGGSTTSGKKKGGARAINRSQSGHESSNAGIMMNGEVSCLFWEQHTSLYLNLLEQQFLSKKDGEGSNTTSTTTTANKGKNDSSSTIKSLPFSSANAITNSSTVNFAREAAEVMMNARDSKKNNQNNTFHPPSSKWIAMGSSKGQVILHNASASYLSHQIRKTTTAAITNSSNVSVHLHGSRIHSNFMCSPGSRTITIPCKNKRRVTCGAWEDNLLVFGSIGTGQLTMVSTFPKSMEETTTSNSLSSSKGNLRSDGKKNVAFSSNNNRGNNGNTIDETFQEKTIKVLGNMVLPGGRDAFHIALGTLDEECGAKTILSVNCEAKCLLFYTFPKMVDDSSSNTQAPITAAAMEISFSIRGVQQSSITHNDNTKPPTATCGHIIHHFLIPDTCLVLVAFSSGYFALVDWVNGVIISDAEVVSKKYSNLKTGVGKDDDPFLLDVAFHLPSYTFTCLTKSGHVIAFQVRILQRCQEIKPGDCTCSTGLTISTKMHTRPKAKSSSFPHALKTGVDLDLKSAPLGTIDTLCSHKIDNVPSLPPEGKKGSLLDFSADGGCVSVALGDESVTILRLSFDDFDTEREKAVLAESIFVGRKRCKLFSSGGLIFRQNSGLTFIFSIICLLVLFYLQDDSFHDIVTNFL